MVLSLTVASSCGGGDSGPTSPSTPSADTTTTSAPASGANYYVAPNGSDDNPGTEAQPWQTIQKATQSLQAGDTLNFREGTYRERLVPKDSGTSYMAYRGENVTLDGSGLSLPQDMAGLVEVSGLSDIRISGLRITNAGPGDNHCGILVMDSSDIVIDGNTTYNTASSGIGVWDSSDVTLSGNEVELCCNDGEQECITVSGTDTFEIVNNHVHHGGPGSIGGEGIDAKEGSSNGMIHRNHVHHLNNRLGIYIDAWDRHTHDIAVYQNIVHDIAGDDGFALASESGGLLENIQVYNNIAYNNGLSGISLSTAGESGSHPVRSVQIINNTFYNNGSGIWGGGISIENPDASDVVVRNNICSRNRWFQINVEVPAAGLTIDHNLIYGTRGDDENDGIDGVEGDPRFVSASGADFHLGNGSPAIDAGSSVDAPMNDFDGNSRPRGSGYDIGAYEK
jgi:parallel beta-helix repeat protein